MSKYPLKDRADELLAELAATEQHFMADFDKGPAYMPNVVYACVHAGKLLGQLTEIYGERDNEVLQAKGVVSAMSERLALWAKTAAVLAGE